MASTTRSTSSEIHRFVGNKDGFICNNPIDSFQDSPVSILPELAKAAVNRLRTQVEGLEFMLIGAVNVQELGRFLSDAQYNGLQYTFTNIAFSTFGFTNNQRDSSKLHQSESIVKECSETEILTNCETQAVQVGWYDSKNQKKALEFLLMAFVNAQGRDVLSVDSVVDCFLTNEQCNGLLNMFGNSNFLSGVIHVSILSGTRCKRELSGSGNRGPSQSGNAGAGYISQVPGNAAHNERAQAYNNPQYNVVPRNVAVGYRDGGGRGLSNNGPNETMLIYIYELNIETFSITFKERLWTNVIANDSRTWQDLAQKIHEVWLQRNKIISPLIVRATPANCWPGGETIFGSRTHGMFQSLNWRNNLNNVGFIKYLNLLLVIENVSGSAKNAVAYNYASVSYADRRITAFLYNFRHDDMAINMVKGFNVAPRHGTFQSWSDVAREIDLRNLEHHGLQRPVIGNHDVNPAHCWPGADTIFGRRAQGSFQSLNWPNYEWSYVKSHLTAFF